MRNYEWFDFSVGGESEERANGAEIVRGTGRKDAPRPKSYRTARWFEDWTITVGIDEGVWVKRKPRET